MEGQKYEDNPNSIKYYVKRYILTEAHKFAGKTIVDFPAGNGVTTRILAGVGARPVPLDLFPEYFELADMTCIRANIQEGLPLEDKSADGLICQEGIEHFSDQFGALREFNRILKPGGLLLITTPNYSNLRARLSYLLSESERFNTMMPPNELDSIWMSREEITDEIYFGHIFLIGVQKLRVLARLSGFEIAKVYFTKAKSTSLLLFPFLYPWIWLTNWWVYRRQMRKNHDFDMETKRKVYGEQFKLAVNPTILVGGHLMIEFVKEKDSREVSKQLRSRHKEFGTT
jgi:SAM-dependent methyltransferase